MHGLTAVFVFKNNKKKKILVKNTLKFFISVSKAGKIDKNCHLHML